MIAINLRQVKRKSRNMGGAEIVSFDQGDNKFKKLGELSELFVEFDFDFNVV